jgi:hypothetical protein
MPNHKAESCTGRRHGGICGRRYAGGTFAGSHSASVCLYFLCSDLPRACLSELQGGPAHTFADIYLDTMAKSSKCSKVLRDKQLTERLATVNIENITSICTAECSNSLRNWLSAVE